MKEMQLLRAMSALDDKDIADAWEQPLMTEHRRHPLLTRILEIGGLAACAALAVGMIVMIKGMNSRIETAASLADSADSEATAVRNEDSASGTSEDGTTDTKSEVNTNRDDSGESSEHAEKTTTGPLEQSASSAQTENTTTDPRVHGTAPADITTADPPENCRTTEKTAETVSKPELGTVKIEAVADYEYPAHRIHDPDCAESMFSEFFDYGRGGNFRQFCVSQAGDPDIPKYALAGLQKGYDVTAVFLRVHELGHHFTLKSDPTAEEVHYGYNRLNLVVEDADPAMAEQETCLHVLVLMTKPGVMPELQNVVEERVTVPLRRMGETEQEIATKEILAKKLNQTAPDHFGTVLSAPEILSQLYYCLGPNDVTFLYELDEKYPIEYLAGADRKSPYCIYRLDDGGSLVLYFNENPNSLLNVSYAFVVYDLLTKEDFAELKPGMTLADTERIDAGEKLIHTYNLCYVSRNMTLHMVEGGFVRILYTGGESQYWTDRKIGSDEIIIRSVEFIPNGSNVGDIDPLCDQAHFDVLPGDYDVITGKK